MISAITQILYKKSLNHVEKHLALTLMQYRLKCLFFANCLISNHPSVFISFICFYTDTLSVQSFQILKSPIQISKQLENSYVARVMKIPTTQQTLQNETPSRKTASCSQTLSERRSRPRHFQNSTHLHIYPKNKYLRICTACQEV